MNLLPVEANAFKAIHMINAITFATLRVVYLSI